MALYKFIYIIEFIDAELFGNNNNNPRSLISKLEEVIKNTFAFDFISFFL
jgi:hypothetical protein